MKKSLFILTSYFTMLMCSLAFCMNANSMSVGHIKSVTAITEVFGDGQKLTAVTVEYDKDILNAKLSKSSFTIEGRTITTVYANTSVDKSSQGIDGKYVIIELSPTDKGAALFVQSGWTSKILEAKVSVKQTGDIITTDGETFSSNTNAITNTNIVNLVVDDFKQFEYKDSKTGKVLKYNLFVPKNYDKNKAYPMVLFMHDAGVTSPEPKTTLV